MKQFLYISIFLFSLLSSAQQTYKVTEGELQFILKGQVIDTVNKTGIPGVNIVFKKNQKYNTITDMDGDFQIIFSDTSSIVFPETIYFSFFEYHEKTKFFKDIKELKASKELKIYLKPNTQKYGLIIKSSFWQRIKWKIKKWFGKK